MAEEVVPSPSNPSKGPEQASTAPLEADLDRLAGEFAKHKESPEMSGVSDKEILKQAIKSVTTPPPTTSQAASTDDDALPAYMKDAAPAAKLEVEDLLRTAFKDGIAKATNVARKSSPFVLDAFHDALAGKLHEELVKRKMI